MGQARSICGTILRTIDHVIPRRPFRPTWESPGTMFVSAQQIDEWFQEIATVALLPRNDIPGDYSMILKKRCPFGHRFTF